MTRAFWVFLHRWTGLAMAGFLVLVGLTGSLLAFKFEIEHAIAPQLYATPRDGVALLDFPELAERAERLAPNARAIGVTLSDPGQATVQMRPRNDPATGEPYELEFDQILLDPWTGNELARRTWGDISQGLINLLPFIDRLHYELALGKTGFWALGVIALLWTIDCFVGFYLTLPQTTEALWRRWKPAWLIKLGGSLYRVNFDLHRAGGLWLWTMLLIFAWSSVYMNLWDTVYTWTTRAVLDFRPIWIELVDQPQALENPRIDFQTALPIGEKLMAEQAARHGFSVERPACLTYLPGRGVYRYCVRSDHDVRDRASRTEVYFDAETGVLRLLALPTGQYGGNTVTSWLAALHMADVFGLPYKIFVCLLGLVVAMLSATGVYIWWKKRQARRSRARGRRETAAYSPAE
jgi:uncharacterized iron-regulated membrane protein